ncbi:D-alanyl-D-alanine carboxypeptidase family protein [Pseudalkalibacillus salsuginis]|uniref:D-alanyl-D-alanine carboxypeptidase family protein n=1 Tax=Pseudalkalibacillus salsuginis TaxID=2910972 RepID=UPI001F17314B|nr:D-alanyl-D-alanine carboxypeptidase family protein [Pseudalkalibacillus salsuginis]MCF6408303.1 D-alanyl-D-alanine carboxypeptidase [Pseudalkalibacillus salsuginis]
MKRFFLSMIAAVMGVSVLTPAAFANENHVPVNSLADKASSAILIERDTGTVLFDKNADEKLPPASMTKIMTMILVMEALHKGKINLKDKVRTSEYAASMGGSQIFLEAGEVMTVEEMLKGVALASGNDASVALGEFIAGTNEAFVKMMNDKAKELGLKNTKFKNATGLPEKDHYSTARDMALMAKELLKYEQITKYTGMYEDYLRQNTDKKFWLVNTNKLVKFYPGVDGLKTGYTNEAKYCLTATAKKDDMRVIAVVMGAPTTKERNTQVTQMLDYAFANYETERIYERHQMIDKIPVQKGVSKTVQMATSEPISLLMKKGEKKMKLTTEIKINKQVKMPIEKGERLGTLVVKNNGKTVTESPLVASENVEAANWWGLFKRTVGKFSQTP